MPVSEQVLIIYAVSNGFLDGVDTKKLRGFETFFLSWIKEHHAEVVNELSKNGKMTKDLIGKFNPLITEAVDIFSQEESVAKEAGLV